MLKTLKRYASRRLEHENKSLRADLADTQATLDAAQRELEVITAENKTLAAVVARNHKRVEAETAQAAAQIATSEQGQVTNENPLAYRTG